ncbi:hypothetical protein MMC25_006514 [Agyrium rufum]|nr:hypothetical protein [Agyrium rufum]
MATEAAQDHNCQTPSYVWEAQLEELDAVEERRKGKCAEGVVTDEDTAFETFRNELKSMLDMMASIKLAESIATAVRNDADAIAEITRLEDIEQSDRAIVEGLAGVQRPAPPAADVSDVSGAIDERIFLRMAVLNGTIIIEEDEYDPAGSSKQRVEDGELVSKKQKCCSCMGSCFSFDVYTAPCNHPYCRECVVELFTASMKDESLFPPRCCREVMSISTVEEFLSPEFQRAFEAKRVEFTTLDRTYCSQPLCSAFLPSASITADTALCSLCSTTTCAICKSASHNGDCPKDADLQLCLDTASEQGWRRCESCKRMIELTIGCNHIT